MSTYLSYLFIKYIIPMFLLIYSIRKKDVVPKETKNNVTDFEMNISSPPSSKSEVAYQKIPHPQPLTHYITFHCFLIWICSCCFQNKVINKIYAVLNPMQSVLKNDITHDNTFSFCVDEECFSLQECLHNTKHG